ncbi:MAG: agmatinase [Bacteroidota bacterium]
MAPTPPPAALGPRSNFLGLEKASSEYESSLIVLLSAPYEHTVSFGRGTGMGPSRIIKASHYVEFYDEEIDRELCKDVGIATLPSLKFGNRVDKRALDYLQRTVKTRLEEGKFVATLGGEHTISSACIAAHLQRFPALSVIQFDAHSDLRDSYGGNRYSHASVMARVCEVLDPHRLVQVGIRAQCREESEYIKNRGVQTFYAHNIHDGEYAQSSERLHQTILRSLTDHVYVTFDVDCLDPSIMPSTGTPEPNGLSWTEATRIIRMIGESRTIVGFDLVELAPVRGVHHPDLTAARLAYKMMNYAFLGKG